MESSCFGDKVRPLNRSFIGKPWHLTNPRCGAIPPCSSNAGVDPVLQFIRWEIVACNVIYLARNPSQSAQPADTANVLKGD
jgi:hypothetical protein